MKDTFFKSIGFTFFFALNQIFAADPLKMPEANTEGRIYTLNQMGAMNTRFADFEKNYIASLQPGQKVFDMGCAYGATVKEAAQIVDEVWANDLDLRHLEILKNQVKNENYAGKIRYSPGDFTKLTDLPENYFDKILASRVFHFFNGLQIEAALPQALKSLKSGGELHILVTSIYIKFAENFLPEYICRKEAGTPWPGYCENIWEINPAVKGHIPPQYHFLDLDTFTDIIKKYGFDIVKATYMEPLVPFQSTQNEFKDKGYLVIIARK